MVYRYLVVFILLLGLGPLATAQSKKDLDEIRNDLFYSDFDLEKVQLLYDRIIKIKNTDSAPILTAYEASAKALIAKFSWNPLRKLSYLKTAMCLIDKAVILDASNVEIRFLRFYIQNHVPAILGYSKNIEEDQREIANNLHRFKTDDLDMGVFEYVKDYMSQFGVSPD